MYRRLKAKGKLKHRKKYVPWNKRLANTIKDIKKKIQKNYRTKGYKK